MAQARRQLARRLGAVDGRHRRRALRARAPGRAGQARTGRSRDRFILSKGHAGARRLCGARRARLLPGRMARHATIRTARSSRATSRTRVCRGSSSRPARSATGSASAPAWRMRRSGSAATHRGVRAHERRRMRRGLQLGGDAVRRPSPARQPRRHRRLQQDPEPRARSPRRWARAVRRQVARVRLGGAAKSTATTTRRCARDARSGAARAAAGRRCVIADTVKGKGVSFMEHSVLWHYRVAAGRGIRSRARRARDGQGRCETRSSTALMRARARDPRIVLSPAISASAWSTTSSRAARASSQRRRRRAEHDRRSPPAWRSKGHVVFTYSIANFPTLRCLEQIRNDVCYHDANVKVVAVGGGFTYGALGMSHHATEDLAIMRACRA